MTPDNPAPAVATLTVTPVTVLVPPTIAKSFDPVTIPVNGVSTLVLTLSNSNPVIDTMTAPLTDQLPAGLTVYGAGSTTCGGTVAAIKGSTAVTLTGGIVPAKGSCTVTVTVTSSVAGVYINTVPSGALKTSHGNNLAPAVATLTVTTVLVPPTIAKSFNPVTIPVYGVSTLVLTLSNSNPVIDTMTAPLTDQLPAGLTVYGGGSTTCGGTVAAIKGSTAVTLTGGIVPAKGSCTVTIEVTSSVAGVYINTVPSGALKTSHGNNLAPAVATLTVTTALVPPTIAKSFNPVTIPVDGISTLVLTLSNSNPVIDTMTAPLTDQLPAGLTVYGAGSTTCGGTVAAIKGSTAVTLTGGIIPAKGSCIVTVEVTSSVAGVYINTVPPGALKTSHGNNLGPAVAILTVTAVLVPPTLGKSFNPATIPQNGVSTLILKLSNSNSVIDTMTAPLTDHLPAGLTVYGGASTTCGGTVAAIKGGTTVTLTGGVIPVKGFCTVSVIVSPDCECSYHNVVSAGALQTDHGKNAAPAVATLTVTKAILGGTPVLGKFFYPDTIKPGGSTTLTITLTNPDAKAATLTAPFTDPLPSGMVVFGLPTDVPYNTCGGTLSAPKGGSFITLTGGTIPANGTCRIVVYVTVKNAGTYVNSLKIGTLKTSNGSNKLEVNATLFVSVNAGAGPWLLKSFSPATIKNDGISTLTITLNNPYSTAATIKAPLDDYMPKGMVVYGSAHNTCGGAVTATPGTSILILTGGAIPAKGSCTVTVQVTAPCNTYFNNLPAGALLTSNGSNQEPAGASLTVTPD